jgi:hypothetical protein
LQQLEALSETLLDFFAALDDLTEWLRGNSD